MVELDASRGFESGKPVRKHSLGLCGHTATMYEMYSVASECKAAFSKYPRTMLFKITAESMFTDSLIPSFKAFKEHPRLLNGLLTALGRSGFLMSLVYACRKISASEDNHVRSSQYSPMRRTHSSAPGDRLARLQNVSTR
jgi:hypothetical protein